MRRSIATALAFLLVAGCASGGAAPATAGETAGDATSARTARGSINLIPSAEIEEAGAELTNAWDLVNRLRPTMMRARGRSSGTTASGGSSGPIVYVDEMRLGSVDLLRTVQRGSISQIRFISSTDATTRWGLGYPDGVIQVITKR